MNAEYNKMESSTLKTLSTASESIKTMLENNYHLYLEGHTSFINALAITTDCKYIISASCDKTIRI